MNCTLVFALSTCSLHPFQPLRCNVHLFFNVFVSLVSSLSSSGISLICDGLLMFVTPDLREVEALLVFHTERLQLAPPISEHTVHSPSFWVTELNPTQTSLLCFPLKVLLIYHQPMNTLQFKTCKSLTKVYLLGPLTRILTSPVSLILQTPSLTPFNAVPHVTACTTSLGSKVVNTVIHPPSGKNRTYRKYVTI